jgi:lipoyl-dependent peroxiredoxin
MERRASAVRRGSGLERQGAPTTASGALDDRPYSYRTRFESGDGTAGTNPEELIAAAHAACFNMALSFILGGAGHPPGELRTEAVLSMASQGVHWTITAVHLELHANVPGIAPERFAELAEAAKATCPVSRVLDAEITLDARLVGGGDRAG